MTKNIGKRNIELTSDQYLALLKAVYLGNWMANAHRDGSPQDPLVKEYESVEDCLFSFAPQFGLKKFVSHEKGDGTHFYPTNDFLEKTAVHKLHDEYDEETFWDELCSRMGERDFYRKYPMGEMRNMNDEEQFLKLQECVIAWEEETEKHGIERLDILRTFKDIGI
jgi:hypothetical protein